MTVELITGQGSTDHIGSEDIGEYQAYTFGTGCYVLNGCECTVVDSNTVRIAKGMMLIEGRHVRVKGSEDLKIQSGSTGLKRNDLIVVRYTRDSNRIEDAPLAVIPGTATEGEATDPSYVQGSILAEDSAADFPLYRIPIDGLAVGEPVLLMERQEPFVDHTHDYLPLTGGTLTGNLYLKSNSLDYDGGAPSSNVFGSRVITTDKDNTIIGNFRTYHNTRDEIVTGMYARRLIDGSEVFNEINAYVGADGTRRYYATDPEAFRDAIGAATWQDVYPVGAVYISYVSTSPASLFGGTWTAITGAFPYFNAGTSKGGSNTHTLTVAQMPRHEHGYYCRNGKYLGHSGVWSFDTQDEYYSDWAGSTWISSAGGGGSHNNMPAYQTLYAWRRTA